MRAVDKLDKISEEEVGAMLVEDAGLTREQADSCLALARISATDTSFVEQVRALGVHHELLDEGLAELAAVIEGCAPLVTDRVEIVADLKIARGLDYYTGTVFETRLNGYESLGSICSGGRYDALASDGRTTYPGVGISLGVSRVLVPLLGKGVVEADRSVPSAVLVAVVERGEPHRQRRPRRAASRQRHSLRGRAVGRRSSASRSVTPSDAASRTSSSPALPTSRPRSRTSAAASRPPSTSAPGRRRSRTCARASDATNRSNSDPHPRRRQPAASPRRHRSHPRRMGGATP